MVLYVGEQIRISTKAREYALKGATGSIITDEDATSVTISIMNGKGEVYVDEANMVWSDDESIWFYKWDTSSGSPSPVAGSYHYRTTVVGADGKPSVEWGKVRLARQPF